MIARTKPTKRSVDAGRSARDGYTAVEVIVAISLFAVGAGGVIAMQQMAVLSNVDARRLDTANAINRTWLERLRRDAAAWTLPSPTNATSNRGSVPLLATVPMTWAQPTAYLSATPSWSPAADVLGSDVAPANAFFCTQIQLSWLQQEQLVLAQVRTFWPRGINVAPDANYCTGTIDPEATVGKYHVVYANSALRKNTAP